MHTKKMGIKAIKLKKSTSQKDRTYPRPTWVKSGEAELCSDCFKVVGDRSRYKLVCMLGGKPSGMNVSELTDKLKLKQPTVTHHLNILRSVQAVSSIERGRERVYTLNGDAHCFDECKIPY